MWVLKLVFEEEKTGERWVVLRRFVRHGRKQEVSRPRDKLVRHQLC
jgi:hypothetical protein